MVYRNTGMKGQRAYWLISRPESWGNPTTTPAQQVTATPTQRCITATRRKKKTTNISEVGVVWVGEALKER